MSDEGAPPLLRVVKGEPTDEELAALVAVLATRTTAPPQRTPPGRSAWVRSGFVMGVRTRADW